MKIVMLAGNSDSTLYMYNGLKKHFNIDKVIIEERPDKVTFIKRRINKMGILKVIGQIVFIIYSKLLFKVSRNKIERLKTILSLDGKEIDDEVVEKIQSVNSRETKLLLVKLDPDIVIVNGTRIISKDILNSIDGIFLNTHLGITPKYRGVHGGYWALANDDKENCGTTVHIVNSGIDTGDILYQRTIEVTKKDNYCTYQLHQISIGIDMMKMALEDYRLDRIKINYNDLESNLWSHPDIVTYFKNWILKGVK